jgi:hypothetical protein
MERTALISLFKQVKVRPSEAKKAVIGINICQLGTGFSIVMVWKF